MRLPQIVLLVAGVSVGTVFGLPLFLTPIRWARVFQWQFPEDLRLARYFGRCLGGVALAQCALALAGAFDPRFTQLALAVSSLACVTLTIVHIVGMLERSQPATENVETFFWIGLTVSFTWLAFS